jgi:hypothetical protein
MLVNEKGKVMTIQGDIDSENRNIIVENKSDKIGQTWDLIYSDEMPPDLKKGDMNKDWGMKVETPFYIVSNLKSGRQIDLVGNRMTIKVPNGRSSQLWYFDNKSKTIHSQRTRSYSWTSSGNKMVVGGTNSRW